MAGEEYIPKVGDKVAIVGWQRIGQNTATPAIVTKVYKRYIMIGERRFSLPNLRESRAPGRSNWGSLPDRVEPWTEEHDEQAARARAVYALLGAAGAAFETGAARAEIGRLPTARLLEAAAFLRALTEEAKAVKL